MREKKLFSFNLEEKLKEKMKKLSEHRQRSIGYIINEAVDIYMKDWDERLKKTKENEGN